MYKIETHLHTKYISKCGCLSAEQILQMYSELGYAGICVTDHYNRECLEFAGIDTSGEGSKTEEFLFGYRTLKEKAKNYNIRIYEGAELRFDGSENDYLLYGFDHDLIANPEKVISGGLEAFSRKCREQGALLIQAHPCRKMCSPAPYDLIDGVEVHNANPRHNSFNELAWKYAKAHSLLMLSGSDCHEPGDQGRGGVICECLPKDSFEFAKIIREQRYELIINS